MSTNGTAQAPGAERARSARPAARRSRRSASTRFLSDCETTALVAPSGNVEWLCLPRLDSPSVFGAILDRDAGGFRFGPSDIQRAGRAPLPARARWCSRRAGARRPAGSSCATCCSSARGITRTSRSHDPPPRRRPTTTPSHVLLRMVRCVNGEMQLTLDCEPVFDYGRAPRHVEYTEDGYHQGACRARGQRRRAAS